MTTTPNPANERTTIDDDRPCGSLARRMAAKMGERYAQLLAAAAEPLDKTS